MKSGMLHDTAKSVNLLHRSGVQLPGFGMGAGVGELNLVRSCSTPMECSCPVRSMRQVIDAGNDVRIGELSPPRPPAKKNSAHNYTWRATKTGRRTALNQPEM